MPPRSGFGSGSAIAHPVTSSPAARAGRRPPRAVRSAGSRSRRQPRPRLHSEALAAGALAANALRGEGPRDQGTGGVGRGTDAVGRRTGGMGAVPGVWAGVPTEPPATIAGPPPATRRGRPVAFPSASALRSSPRRCSRSFSGTHSARVEWRARSTRRVRRRVRRGSEAPPGRAPQARARREAPTVDGPTDPADPTGTGRVAESTNDPVQTPRPTATATPRPGATATPTPQPTAPGATPTPTPPATPAPTPTPSPRPTPTPTARHRRRPYTAAPACDVPDLVGLTVVNARSTWRGRRLHRRFTPRKVRTNGSSRRKTGHPAHACRRAPRSR